MALVNVVNMVGVVVVVLTLLVLDDGFREIVCCLLAAACCLLVGLVVTTIVVCFGMALLVGSYDALVSGWQLRFRSSLSLTVLHLSLSLSLCLCYQLGNRSSWTIPLAFSIPFNLKSLLNAYKNYKTVRVCVRVCLCVRVCACVLPFSFCAVPHTSLRVGCLLRQPLRSPYMSFIVRDRLGMESLVRWFGARRSSRSSPG